MPVRFTILGSGSSGNCAYLETDETRVLIDAGLSGRQIRQRLASIGRTPETLDAILLTHEHTDHVRGLKTICPKLNVPVFCNRLTHEAVGLYVGGPFEARMFASGAGFEVGDLLVETFSVPHDAHDPVGFVIHTPLAKIGFLTDLGHVTRLVMERVRQANILVLETNYDFQMLQDDLRRPWSIKQRIASRHGHLSNDDAAHLAENIVSEELKHLYLGHLSRDCNTPKLAHDCIHSRLQGIGATHLQINTASQETPTETLELR